MTVGLGVIDGRAVVLRTRTMDVGVCVGVKVGGEVGTLVGVDHALGSPSIDGDAAGSVAAAVGTGMVSAALIEGRTSSASPQASPATVTNAQSALETGTQRS